MKSSRKDIIAVALLIENDLSRELKLNLRLYQEAGYCKVVRVTDDVELSHIRSVTSVYDAKTLYKVVQDIIDIKRSYFHDH